MNATIRHGIEFATNHYMAIVPGNFFYTKGAGVYKKEMRAFKKALRDEGVYTFHNINVSGVIPPDFKLISKEKGMKLLSAG